MYLDRVGGDSPIKDIPRKKDRGPCTTVRKVHCTQMYILALYFTNKNEVSEYQFSNTGRASVSR